MPVSIDLDLGEQRPVRSLAINQRAWSPTYNRETFGRKDDSSRIGDYTVDVSDDGVTWMAARRIEEFVDNDLAFHRTIAAAAGNPVLAKLLDSLSGSTVRARMWRGISQGGAIDRTIAEHRAIYEALEQRRPEMARAWMTVHLTSVETWLESALEPVAELQGSESP